MGKGRTAFTVFSAAILAALALSGGSLAAGLSGDLRAHVQDGQAKALPGIEVTLLRAGKSDSRKQVTDAAGDARFGDLEGGVWVAAVTADGYDPVTCPGVRIVGGTRQLQITLVAPGGEQGSSCQLAPEG